MLLYFNNIQRGEAKGQTLYQRETRNLISVYFAQINRYKHPRHSCCPQMYMVFWLFVTDKLQPVETLTKALKKVNYFMNLQTLHYFQDDT